MACNFVSGSEQNLAQAEVLGDNSDCTVTVFACDIHVKIKETILKIAITERLDLHYMGPVKNSPAKWLYVYLYYWTLKKKNSWRHLIEVKSSGYQNLHVFFCLFYYLARY